MNGSWEHFEHEADIGVRGYGRTPADAFEQAALAMTAIVTDLEKLKPNTMVEINRFEMDMELLFVDWLNALVFEMATRKMLFSRFHVELDGNRLHATACGEPVDAGRHSPATEVKGATYTELEMREDEPGRWRAQCVVDV